MPPNRGGRPEGRPGLRAKRWRLRGDERGEDVADDERTGRPGSYDDPDTLLMMRLAAGDDSVFERIVANFERQVYGIIYRYMRDRALAEDCAQEVFLRIFKMRKSYKPAARVSTLIYRITTNLCLNALRDEGRRQMASLDAPYGEDEAPLSAALVGERVPAVDAEITARERAETVHRALLRIPDRQRIALILHRFEGLSYADIAEAMETNMDAVKALLNRGRQSLAEALRKDLEAGNL